MIMVIEIKSTIIYWLHKKWSWISVDAYFFSLSLFKNQNEERRKRRFGEGLNLSQNKNYLFEINVL